MKQHSKERGCDGKTNFGTHVTTKLQNAGKYKDLLYRTDGN